MRWLHVVGGLLVLAGCKPKYAGLDFTVEDAVDGTVVTNDEISLVAGYAVLVAVQVDSRRNVEYARGEDELELETEDDRIVIVERTDVDWEFLLVGAEPGETCVRVLVNGDEQDCIPTTVLAQ